MQLKIDPANGRALLREDGEPATYAVEQADGQLLTQIGGVTLGTPAEVDGQLVFDHAFPEEAVALLRSRAATRAAVEGTKTAEEVEDSAYAPHRPGLKVEIGDILTWEGVAYVVRQAHVTQADWLPPKTPAFSEVR